MVLAFVRKGGKINAGKKGITVEETNTNADGSSVKTTVSQGSGCADYQAEHLAVMHEMRIALGELKQTLLGLNAMQIAETEALGVLLGLAEGEEVNGQVKAARQALTKAQGFKEATETMTGGM
jgi:hypothetical protein